MADPTETYLRNDTVAPEALSGKFDRNYQWLPPFAEQDAGKAEWPDLAPEQALDRAKGCLMGLAVGEAIGSAVEFLPRDSYDEVSGMQGGGPLGIEPGEWTDGTAMALCLARSLLASETVEQYDFMERLQGWLTNAENTARGRTLAVGDTTRIAIESFIADEDPSAGSPLAEAAGNGSLIRQAPLAIYASKNRKTARFMSNKQSRATHATIECLDACDLFMDQLVDALTGADKAQTLRPRVIQLSPNLLAINGGEWRDKGRDDLRSSAYVIDTLDAAIWAVGHSNSFREAVLLAANLGGDAASVAAIAGQLAGAIYGCSAIPEDWQATVAAGKTLTSLAEELLTEGAKVFPA
jgi:ADP-ribosyl-[dinitrogen reductase] hydrolase